MTVQELINVLNEWPNKNQDVRLIVRTVGDGGRVYRIHASLESVSASRLYGTDESFDELLAYETAK